jgi:hypothetical protein
MDDKFPAKGSSGKVRRGRAAPFRPRDVPRLEEKAMNRKPLHRVLIALAIASTLSFGSVRPAAAAQTPQLRQVLSWLSCMATSPFAGNVFNCGLEIDPNGSTVQCDRGLEIDPNGHCSPIANRGLEIDPNGSTVQGECGPEIDPDGHCQPTTDRGAEIDPDGGI